jgi:hypothetical protein
MFRLYSTEEQRRTVARQNGRLLLYLMTPLLVIGPCIAKDGPVWWGFALSLPLAVINVLVCRYLIRWGEQTPGGEPDNVQPPE